MGAQKAGTQSLMMNLRRHPGAFLPEVEVHFFDQEARWAKGIDWYREQFRRGAGKVCGEKTPRYMTKRLFMERAASVVPDAKIIVLLRDPTARFFSHLNHKIHAGTIPRPDVIDEAFLRQQILSRDSRRYNFLDRGHYIDQIEQYILPLFPYEKVFIRATDEWSGTTERTATRRGAGLITGVDRSEFTMRLYREVQEFLGLTVWEPEELEFRHSRPYSAEITAQAKVLIREQYAESNERLFEFLGYEIPQWRGEA